MVVRERDGNEVSFLRSTVCHVPCGGIYSFLINTKARAREKERNVARFYMISCTRAVTMDGDIYIETERKRDTFTAYLNWISSCNNGERDMSAVISCIRRGRSQSWTCSHRRQS